MQPIKISVPRATPEELQRVVEAAMTVFRTANVHPMTAATGLFRLEAIDTGADVEISDDEAAAAMIWGEADAAALETACAGWEGRRKPQSANMEIIVYPHAQLADRQKAMVELRKTAKIHPGKWSKDEDRRVGIYARIIADQVEDPFAARNLVDPVTIAFHRLTSTRYQRHPLEAPRQHLCDVVEGLIDATEPRN